MPTFDGCDDFVRVGGPCEGLWHLICLCEEAVDSGLEIDDGSEDATFQAPLGQLGEVTLHGVEPGARRTYQGPPSRCSARWCPAKLEPATVRRMGWKYF